MGDAPVLRMVDAITVPVPDLDQGLEFYRDRLGHEMLWRNDELGQAGLRLPESNTELVLSTSLEYAPNWLVTSVDDAVDAIVRARGRVLAETNPDPGGSARCRSRPLRQRAHPARPVIRSLRN
jgi:catechol 2,3-dioxygenase-like lactoylglutathione lyase family enzyme